MPIPASRPIALFGDPNLRSVCAEVKVFDSAIESQARMMADSMRTAGGIGLAAPQLGFGNRLFVVRAGDGYLTLVNPELTQVSDELATDVERCLSLPGVALEIPRHSTVFVRASDVCGEPLEFEVSDMAARVIQHEMDHLNGTLILHRADRGALRAALPALLFSSPTLPTRGLQLLPE